MSNVKLGPCANQYVLPNLRYHFVSWGSCVKEDLSVKRGGDQTYASEGSSSNVEQAKPKQISFIGKVLWFEIYFDNDANLWCKLSDVGPPCQEAS